MITGFGRTGKLFALDHWGVEPDIVQFAKAITSGYFPFGGIGISDKLMETISEDGRPLMHAYTYSAHPVGCAVALRMLDIVESERFPQQGATKGRYLLRALHAALDDHPHVGNVRGMGLMCAVELVQDKATKATFPAEQKVGLQIQRLAIEQGLFSRVKGDSYLLAPPLIISTDQLDRDRGHSHRDDTRRSWVTGSDATTRPRRIRTDLDLVSRRLDPSCEPVLIHYRSRHPNPTP